MKKYIVPVVAGFMIFGCGARVVNLDVKSETKVVSINHTKLCVVL